MDHIKKFAEFVNEKFVGNSPKIAPSKPEIDTPSRPSERPVEPEKPERRKRNIPYHNPSVNPNPKGVAEKFLKILKSKGISPKKYVK
jgi:Fe-S oxidoreductase